MPHTRHFDSAAIPGASFDLKLPGKKLRNRAEIALAEERHQQTMIDQEQYSIVPAEVRSDVPKLVEFLKSMKLADSERLSRLKIKMQSLNELVRMGYAEEMLASFVLPGEEYAELQGDNAALFESGPVEFVDEILSESEKMWALSSAEIKNSLQPSISPEAEAGKTLQGDGTAISAESVETT